jgi:hypothetical protein
MKKRSGQAMVEFLLGLVGVMVLILGFNLIARVVNADFDVVIATRADVAQSIYDNASSGSLPGSSFSGGSFFSTLAGNIAYEGGGGSYSDYLESYDPSDRPDGYSFLATGEDPIDQNVAGSIGIATVSNIPDFLRKLLGKSSISFESSVAMPYWDDLMSIEE